MKRKAQAPKYLLLLGLTALAACTGGKSGSGPAWTLHTSRLEALSIVPALPALPLRWPQFLLVEGTDRFLWGERGLFRLATSENGPILEEPEGAELTRGMDRLIAAAEAPDGTLAVLDMAGRVAVQSPRRGETWEFEAQLPKQPAGLAVTEGLVYILLQGEPLEGDAVVAYGFDGVEAGRWGTMPADGIIQASLRGGGIAACPDGSVYYSYINSPRILRLPDGADESVRAIGEPSSSFVEVPARKVRYAQDKGKRYSSVAPLVKLGLSASRVLSLLCSEEGLLFRQVAQPAHGGAIEVWDPLSEELVGTIPVGGEVLLDVRDQILYLGARSESEGFTLTRIHYRAERSRPSEVAGR
jgi:hypothetical protein